MVAANAKTTVAAVQSQATPRLRPPHNGRAKVASPWIISSRGRAEGFDSVVVVVSAVDAAVADAIGVRKKLRRGFRAKGD